MEEERNPNDILNLNETTQNDEDIRSMGSGEVNTEGSEGQTDIPIPSILNHAQASKKYLDNQKPLTHQEEP